MVGVYIQKRSSRVCRFNTKRCVSNIEIYFIKLVELRCGISQEPCTQPSGKYNYYCFCCHHRMCHIYVYIQGNKVSCIIYILRINVPQKVLRPNWYILLWIKNGNEHYIYVDCMNYVNIASYFHSLKYDFVISVLYYS